jgi:hypothetical protein
MVDCSFIGKNGLIIQFEDTISAIGFNVMKYLRTKIEPLSKIPIQDIMLSYMNREVEDIATWMDTTYGVKGFNLAEYATSPNTFQPNFLYAFKMFDAAYQNGIKKLMVYSAIESPVIRECVEKSFTVPIEYIYGDIVPVLNSNPNTSFLTASPKTIDHCLEVSAPFALTICDDYMYTAPVLINKTDEKLRSKGVFVGFTSILNAGVI